MPRNGGRPWRSDRARFLDTTTETHCWLTTWCGGTHVDRTLPGTHPMGPTADHEVPLMLGGPELVRDGAILHLAHNRCNAARSNRLRMQAPVPQQFAPRTVLTPPRTSRDW